MIASILTDIALVIAALTGLVAAATGWLAVRRGRRLEAKVRDVAITVDGIDHATNQQPDGAPTLPERLAAIDTRLDEFLTTDTIRAEFAAVHTRLDQLAETMERHHPEDPTS